jgi:mRNA interferase MazF
VVIEQGHVVWVDLGGRRGSAPAGRRPAVVIQSDDYNRSTLATMVIVAVTSNTRLALMPGNVAVPHGVCGLDRDSVVNVTAIATIDMAEVREDAGPLPLDLWQRVATGVRLVLHTPFAGPAGG